MSPSHRQGVDESAGWLTAGHSAVARDLTGVTLGDFQVEKLLGRGGMGEVYLANQRSLNRPVALKVLRTDQAMSTTYLERLRSEATAVAKLNHPNIVHVYTLDKVDGVQFIAMEYVQGTNLKDYVDKKGPLDLALALSVMRQTGQAIGAAGELGLIHRDVKPENILMTRKGRVKVADFGLCRDSDRTHEALTQPGIAIGTPLYMSPEQSQGHAMDHRSDLYSMGVTFYHVLTGEPPFRGDSPLAVALKHIREAPRSMLVSRPDLPPALDRIVLKLLAKSPADRYQSAAEMLADLARVKEQLPTEATAAVSRGGRSEWADATDPGPQPPAEPAHSGERIRSAPAVLQVESAAATAGPRPRFRPLAAILLAAASLALGAATGYSARIPNLASLAPPDSTMPGLWLEPGWSRVPKQPTPQQQYRHAQLLAPREDWAAAWLAVPAYHSHSRELVSKAYTQLARMYYRRRDLSALEALEAELSRWNGAQHRDHELVEMLQIAIKSRKGDVEGVVEGLKNVTRDQASAILDPTLLGLALEICVDVADAIGQGSRSIAREPLVACQRILLRRLYRIEVRGQSPPRKGAVGADARPASAGVPLRGRAAADPTAAITAPGVLSFEGRFAWPS